MGNEVANLYEVPENGRPLPVAVGSNGVPSAPSGLGQQFPSINPIVQGKCDFSCIAYGKPFLNLKNDDIYSV